MGLKSRKAKQEQKQKSLPEAGELLPIEALDQSGLLVRSDGAFVRYIHVVPPNPLIMGQAERKEVAEFFGYLLARLSAGQFLQFYVEARPLVLGQVLRHSREEVERIAGPPPSANHTVEDELALARWRLYSAMEETLRLHSDEQAAVRLDAYVVAPYFPDAQHGVSVAQLKSALRSGTFEAAGLNRELSAHHRAARQSLQHTEVLRTELEALDLPTRILNGEQVAELLWARFNPSHADRMMPPSSLLQGVEVLGDLDTGPRGLRQAREAAGRLRSLIATSSIDFLPTKHVEVDRDIERVIFANGTADVTSFGWLLGAMQTRQPFSMSVTIKATDRIRERTKRKMNYRRLFGINRGAEMRGRVPDFDRYAAEHEHEHLLQKMSSGDRTSIYDVSIYQSLRQRGPSPNESELEMAVNYVDEQIQSASDIRVHRGEFAQKELWRSTLPLGLDVAGKTRKYVTENAAESIPLVGTSCGSPMGIPLGFSNPGRTVERIDPFDLSHNNATLLINGKSGTGKTMVTNDLIAKHLAHGIRAFVLDRAGHYEILTQLVPGSQHITLGSGDESYAINPWDVDDPANLPLEKLTFLIQLHSLLLGEQRSEGVGISATESNLLDVAIRAVYIRASQDGTKPRERDLREELAARSEHAKQDGDGTNASTLRSLADRLESFVGSGSYGWLLDRPTSVRADAPLVVFDTRRVPDDVQGPLVLSLMEFITRKAESHRDENAHLMGRPDTPMFAGRTLAVIDEGWKLVENRISGSRANDLARRARHLGLCLIVISQQLSDFNNDWGRSLLRNSTMQIFLGQAPEELAYVQDALSLTDAETQTIGRLKTHKGLYSEIFFCNGSRGHGALRCYMGPTSYWAFTSEPGRDVPLRNQAIERQGGDAWMGIAELAGHIKGTPATQTRPTDPVAH